MSYELIKKYAFVGSSNITVKSIPDAWLLHLKYLGNGGTSVYSRRFRACVYIHPMHTLIFKKALALKYFLGTWDQCSGPGPKSLVWYSVNINSGQDID